jgi:hypothetical protein
MFRQGFGSMTDMFDALLSNSVRCTGAVIDAHTVTLMLSFFENRFPVGI